MTPDPLETQARTAKALASLLGRLRAAGRLEHPREPGKWTPRQIVHHLADMEPVFAVRYRQTLALERPDLLAFSPDAWAAATDYGRLDPDLALRAFTAERERNLELFSLLTHEAWGRAAVHPFRGELTLRRQVELVAGHDGNHLSQLEASLA